MSRRLIVLSATPLPNVWANSSQLVKTCEALGRRGVALELWARGKTSEEEIFSYYGVRSTFPLRLVPFQKKSERTLFSGHLSYNFSIIRRLYKEYRTNSSFDLYTREVIFWPTLIISRLFWGSRIFFEVHRATRRNWYDGLSRAISLKLAHGIVIISDTLRPYISKAKPIVVAYCGVDSERALMRVDYTAVREKNNIASDAWVIGYVGSFQSYEGVEYLVDALVDALPRLPDAVALLVGGFSEQVNVMEKKVPEELRARIHFVGHVSYTDVPQYLAVSDVLTIPLIKNEPGASPVKMFEYTFFGKPIIATDIPPISEVLKDEESALLVPPHDAKVFAAAIERLYQDRALGARIGERVKKTSSAYTFEERARRIKSLIDMA